MSNRITPYARLLDEFRKFASAVEYPTRKIMWTYETAKLGEGWSLVELHQRVQAAEQLGYDVVLRSVPDGLRVEYRKKPPALPWSVR